jgi:hypothetical protein
LLHIGIALGGRGEGAGDIERLEIGVSELPFRLNGGEQAVVLDGVVDRGGGEQGIEAALTSARSLNAIHPGISHPRQPLSCQRWRIRRVPEFVLL